MKIPNRQQDVITQAELRKDEEFGAKTSSAAHIVRELYLQALARRIAAGAVCGTRAAHIRRRREDSLHSKAARLCSRSVAAHEDADGIGLS
jgi:hypothetical protein